MHFSIYKELPIGKPRLDRYRYKYRYRYRYRQNRQIGFPVSLENPIMLSKVGSYFHE